MATRVSVEVLDDLTGERGAKTYYFSLGTTMYEVDLARDGAALTEALEPFIKAGRRSTSSRRSRSTRAGRPSAPDEQQRELYAAVREWAAEQGIPLGKVGRIPRETLERFEKAQLEQAKKK